ncbi:hypothetical protein ACJMK2_021889 [Sinanodonta woodiana]|uniref:MAM domain-containing protein n=1 Tax=Sinanodonta woodiana TaxID=1069815 RepID=A0ABD3TI33_SINWO
MRKLGMNLILFAAFIPAYANPVDCDFENDSCSWSIEGFRRVSTNQLNITDGFNDNMHRNGSEWYLLFEATNESYATLRSTQTAIEGLQCLNFWYILRGSKQSHIQVFVQGIGRDNASAIWETSTTVPGWRPAFVELDVHYSVMIKIVIQGGPGESFTKIGIDDIVLKPASCLDCSFLDGLCSWDGKRWKVSTNVNYAVTEFQSTPDKSVLTSGSDVYPGEKCFSFKYQMKDFKRECIFIEVYSYDKISWSLVWSSHSQHKVQGWNEINATINVRTKSNIVIRFQHGNCFNVTYYISSISLKKQSCTETTTTFIRSPSTVIPMNCSKGAMTSNKTTNNFTTTFVKLNSTDMATSSLATSVNTSSYYAKDGVIIGIIIGALAFIVAVLLIATYLYRRRAASPNANMSKYRTVSSVTYSGTTRPNTDNVETSQSIDRLDHTSANVSYNSQAVYSTVLKTQSSQSKPQQRCIKGTLNIYPRQTQLLNNDGNNVTNSEQTHNQYLQSADTDGTNSYDTVHNTDNHATEFRDDTYDYTTIHPTTSPDPIYDHSNFKQNFDNVYDHSTPGSLSKDMRYLDHSCEITLQGSMQDVDPTYDHI